MMSAASFNAREARCSPSAANTCNIQCNINVKLKNQKPKKQMETAARLILYNIVDTVTGTNIFQCVHFIIFLK